MQKPHGNLQFWLCRMYLKPQLNISINSLKSNLYSPDSCSLPRDGSTRQANPHDSRVTGRREKKRHKALILNNGAGKYHDEYPRDRSTSREKLVRLEYAWQTWRSWLARRNGRILQLVSIFSYGVPRGVGESFFAVSRDSDADVRRKKVECCDLR